MSSGHLSCACGSRWFALETANGVGGVAFKMNGGVDAYYGLPVCIECGVAVPEVVDGHVPSDEPEGIRHLTALEGGKRRWTYSDYEEDK